MSQTSDGNNTRRGFLKGGALIAASAASPAVVGGNLGWREPPGAREFVDWANGLFGEAARLGSAAGLGRLYLEEASILPPGLDIVRGAQAIEDFWQGMLDNGLVQLSLATLEVGGSASCAYTIGEFNLTIRSSEGELEAQRGHYLTTLLRHRGRWRFQNDAWNSSPM